MAAQQTHVSHWRLPDTTYHYRCPNCQRWLGCAWSLHLDPRRCSNCERTHVAPSPAFDATAWVETRDAPYEMARAAFLLHGRVRGGRHMCTAEGCTREATVLEHRVPFDEGGKTSAENLLPTCSEHDRGRDDEGYGEWTTSPDLRVLNDD
jgi:hypothetical protein